jgi:sugar-specific transcriptional regulator TrmB
MSGYEVAKVTGISRSNVYSALAGLVEKGAAYLMEGNPTKYTAVSTDIFCGNHIRYLTKLKSDIAEKAPHCSQLCEGYVTINSHRHIMDKLYNMLQNVEYRIYMSIPTMYIDELREELEGLVRQGKKVVLLTGSQPQNGIEGSVMYITGKEDDQLRLIVDSSYVLTGDMKGSTSDSALYCGQKNFVNVFKESLRNEIKLIELTKGEAK